MPPVDPSLHFFHRMEKGLDPLFAPRSIAVIGATENPGSVGRTVMANCLASFQGEIYPVNPKRQSVLGKKAYPSLFDLPETPDLAVIVTPAKTVPGIIEQCAKASIPGAVIISAGFKEMGPPGIELENQVFKIARGAQMRVIGPNCLGIMRPSSGLNATFAAGIALQGKIAFISQSGALCTAVLDWSLQEKVGFSAFVSIGSMLDVGWSDLIDYFGHDEETESILIYMESIGDARSFLTAAREVALSKPIILIKAGRSAESAKAAASHTGSLSGSDDVLSAALKRVGVLRVESIADLFSMADLLAKQPPPKGPHLAIVTNAGGPGVIATDALIASGGKLAELDPKSIEAYNSFLPPQWSRNNPIDILGDAKADAYAKAVEIALKNPQSQGVLVILTPQDMTEPTETAKRLTAIHPDKPLLASWMGAKSIEKGKEILKRASIPTFEFPDMACKAFGQMWQYASHLRNLYEVPELCLSEEDLTQRHLVEEIINSALKEGRILLDEAESKKLLAAYGIPVVPTEVAESPEEAVSLAGKFGFPVVVKLYSRTLTHKTDVGGVRLNLNSKEEVETAYREIEASVEKLASAKDFQGVTIQPMIKLKDSYELILGSSIDEQFGPILLFGLGGQLVEVFKDSALAIPPLTSTLARLMMEKTKIYEALHGVRGRKGVDLKKLEQILVQFSSLVVEQRWIKECDMNPILASHEGIVALDARIVLHDPSTHPGDLPKSAIRPYPRQYIEEAILGETALLIRPIRPDDEPLLHQFHRDLSEDTVRQRWFKDLGYEERVAHKSLLRVAFIDYDREIVLIAQNPATKEILGAGRIAKLPLTLKKAAFALVVKDKWQNKGLGTKLMNKLIEVAKVEEIEEIYAPMLQGNHQMQAMCKRLGFQFEPQQEGWILGRLQL